MTVITTVERGSFAERAGVRPGDILVSINNNAINDVLDYRFYLTERHLTLSLRRDDVAFEAVIKKGEYDDIGLDFETPLMDKKHSCSNKCIFCFIDQLPRGMRDSLYFKDDDSRLSFLHGNYITLTNLSDSDIDRIIKMHISPLRVSVHTTDPRLRIKMMNNKHAGEVLGYLRRVADAGIPIDAQIVLCRGINDGAALEQTMHDLTAYIPELESVSVVPAGLTRYREGLYPLSSYTPAEAEQIISQVSAFGDRCVADYGSRIFYCADELYIRAGLPLPSSDYYGEFSQLEDGVGLIASLDADFAEALEEVSLKSCGGRTVSIATGEAAYDLISSLAKRLMAQIDGLRINVYAIKNTFFGESVTVAGLLTAGDIISQLEGRELGDELLYPAAALRAGENPVFLDDVTPEQLSRRLNVPARPVKNDGYELLCAMLGK